MDLYYTTIRIAFYFLNVKNYKFWNSSCLGRADLVFSLTRIGENAGLFILETVSPWKVKVAKGFKISISMRFLKWWLRLLTMRRHSVGIRHQHPAFPPFHYYYLPNSHSSSYPSSHSNEETPIPGPTDSSDWLFPGDTCQLLQIKCLLVDTGS